MAAIDQKRKRRSIENGTVVMAGHSRPKDGVALLAYVPAIHVMLTVKRRGCPAQGRHDDGERTQLISPA
jgi:hypothetical protein